MMLPTHRSSRPGTAVLAAALLLLAGCEVGAGDADEADTAQQDTQAVMETDTQRITVADVGLATPESVLHDEEADVYLVSNINGAPTEKDDDGFISRVAPDGAVEELRWIDGADDDITLHAPKGLAVRGDTLFVADIDTVRAFDRTTGEPRGARGVRGATFLNDLTAGPDGTLYVSDSGLNPDFSSSGTDAIYRFDGDEAVAVVEGADLGGPNGIVAFDDRLAFVTFGAAEVREVRTGAGAGEAGSRLIASLPGGQLDGIVRLDDGSFLVSSWETESVYRVGAPGPDTEAPAGGEVQDDQEPQADQEARADRQPQTGQTGQAESAESVIEGMPSPADIDWDARRQRVLIPIFQEDRLVFAPIRPR